ncbi:MAG: DUF1905 domain-containing protein [Vicinamibacterales bacterium]
MKFRTTILQGGKTATGIQVPADIVEKLGAGKRPPVSITINGYMYRSTVAVMGGKFMIGVSADVREKAGVAGGDNVMVTIELDDAPREVEVPADLKKALAKDAKAKKTFETPETRERRLEKAIGLLRAGTV